MRLEPRTSFRRLQESVLFDAGLRQPSGDVAAGLGQGKENVSVDVLVGGLLCDLERAVERLVEVSGDLGIGGGARDLGAKVQVGLELAGERRRIRSQFLQDRYDGAVGLVKHREQEVITRKLGVAPGPGVALGLLNSLLGFDGELVNA